MIKSNDKIYIESFLENLVVRKNLSQNTIKSYTFDLKLLTDFFSQKCISSLTENELKIYVKHVIIRKSMLLESIASSDEVNLMIKEYMNSGIPNVEDNSDLGEK